MPDWSIRGLPAGATAAFDTRTAGHPTDGRLRIDTSCATAQGRYPLEVLASVPGKTWAAQVALEIAACEEFRPGVYSRSMDELIRVVTAGKPDYSCGTAVPLQTCCASQPRKLRVTIESATSEAGAPLAGPPRFFLFRSLVRPAPTAIDAHSTEFNNVDKEYQMSNGWSLERAITPGLYILVFEHDSYADLIRPRPAGEMPKTVTYRLEVVDQPIDAPDSRHGGE